MANYPLSYAISSTNKVRKNANLSTSHFEYGIDVIFSLSDEDAGSTLHDLKQKFKVYKDTISSIVKSHWGGEYEVQEFRQLSADNTYVFRYTLESSIVVPKEDVLVKIVRSIKTYLG